MSLPSGPIRETFDKQAAYCAGPGQSPFTARVLTLMMALLDANSAIGRRVLAWPEAQAASDALPLRVAAAFHHLSRSGHCPELTQVYPPHRPDNEAFRAAFENALGRFDAELTSWLDGPPQTNETGRSAVILGVGLLLANRFGLPLETFEIGASAGLNLNAFRYKYDLGVGVWGEPESGVRVVSDWRGATPDLRGPLVVRSSIGCDVAPLDPSTDAERLMAYLWPDQPDRVERMQSALEFALVHPPQVELADASDWIKAHVTPKHGVARMLYHTLVWQYLPGYTRRAIEASLASEGAAASDASPLAWFRMEADQSGQPGAGLWMTLWPGGAVLNLGRADFHGRWVEWNVGSL
ncbi:MAG: DUF2332 family protein [Hyphomicrobiaceae bacterium]|nr:DUF2332 family protein [Hyphomicrobiaceae bacterium]MCC0023043.1 DUF2332 family protein [Hyphomicrobiaceae bacterium]